MTIHITFNSWEAFDRGIVPLATFLSALHGEPDEEVEVDHEPCS